MEIKKNSGTHKALQILADTSLDKPYAARGFAKAMWPDSDMHVGRKNGGNGCQIGKGAWLCAGSFLAKLKYKKLVRQYFGCRIWPAGYSITEEGKTLLTKLNSQ